MLYEPRDIVNVRENISTGLIQALLAAFEDWLVGDSKPWTFYAGIGLGTAALATGIPGAAATIYVIGDSVDATFFHSPDGSDVRIFLNGIAHSSIDTYAVAAVWESVNINGLIGGAVNRLDFINYGPSADPAASGILWFGLGPITVNGANAYAQGALSTVATFNISYSILDGDGDTSNFAVKVPRGAFTIAQIESYAQQLASLLDVVIGGKITGLAVTLEAALPGGLKAAAVGTSDVQEGALFTFTNASPYVDSVRVPAWLETAFAGKEVNLEAVGVGAFVAALTAGLDIGGTQVQPSDRYENDYTALARAVKSFRKK